jgi:hypothetical protein
VATKWSTHLQNSKLHICEWALRRNLCKHQTLLFHGH